MVQVFWISINCSLAYFCQHDMIFSVKHEDLFKWAAKSPLLTAAFGTYFIYNSTRHSLENENVQKFIHDKDQQFDIIVSEELFHDAHLMFGQQFNAPIVTICE